MRPVRRLAPPVLVTALSALALAALSGVPYEAAGDGNAVLRLSWRTRVAAVRECRDPTEEELGRLPAHMRPDRVCDWEVPPHRLRVAVDGRVLENTTIEAAGVRGDRPLYVFREFSLPPGSHEVEIGFSPEGPDAHEDGEAGERRGSEGREPDEHPYETRSAFHGRVEMAAGEVILVTLDPDLGRLVRREGEGR